MSKLSNNQGRALEYATLIVFKSEISKLRAVQVEKNSSYNSAKRAWDTMPSPLKSNFKKCALATVKAVLVLEPIILDDGNDTLDLKIQSDQEGKGGDVRDVLLIRRGIHWEIGLSIKHNHMAVKHSRLSKNLDFGKSWFGVNCSTQYWNDVKPIFDMLEKGKKAGSLWRDMTSKESTIYIPLLKAFVKEIKRCYKTYGKVIPNKMVEYLLGKYDFYKVIGIDREKLTRIQTFNIRGTLNKKGLNKTSTIIVPIAKLPKRIVHIGMKPKSNNTVELYMDEGWQFGFRIHNAETKVVPSLKFDVGIIGMPATILTIDERWA